mmetsp:Transcript_4943/g.12046  ORF Transcript_4943/g.12046 Transcript_4943/m.12046 type:complete len:286 (-) Transcript_4943:135-992(-)|eukprot:CAMPEP_0177599054 /NCGR_PEP_ID=MMETSP0419_2-20121207/12753_1 /TAXON_ID=582737 /ORGANISM="Tetraselmis sp., Strain GSL018" /LENGTH=285 /DNA_ID=CAMNT_0019091691 /DNA_START=80 /DNA_END=937 /DNA_ORIENTATION=+
MCRFQEVLGLSEKEITQIKAVNETWHISAEDDGWTMAHKGLTTHLKLLQSAFQSCLSILTEKNAVIGVATIAKLWEAVTLFYQNLNHHHLNEEELVFPFLKKRCTFPERMSSDHKEILQLLDIIRTHANELKELQSPSVHLQQPLIREICETIGKLLLINQEHFLEEEEVGLVLLRKYFTEEEYGPVVQKIMESETMEDLAYLLLGAYTSEKDRIRWCKDVARMPSEVIRTALKPALRRLEINVVYPVHDVASGEEPVLSSPEIPAAPKSTPKMKNLFLSCIKCN